MLTALGAHVSAALIFITIFVLLSAVPMRALLCEGHLLMQDTENKTNNQLLLSPSLSQTC